MEVLFSGRVSVDEARRIKLAVFEVGERFGRLPAMVDLDHLVDFDSGARAAFARPEKSYLFKKVAFYGGNFPLRTLVVTIIRAGKLIAPKAFDFEVKVFTTEAEARRYLELERGKGT